MMTMRIAGTMDGSREMDAEFFSSPIGDFLAEAPRRITVLRDALDHGDVRALSAVLEAAGIVAAAGLARALDTQAQDGGTLVRVIATPDLADEETVCAAIAKGLRFEYVAPHGAEVDHELLGKIAPGFCRDRLVVPIGVVGGSVRLAMADPLDYRTVQDVEFRTGKRVIAVAASETTVQLLLGRLSGEAEVDLGDPDDLQGATAA
jgi:hypothetical protein